MLDLIHPAPPEPGTYVMTVTGTDIENDVESELDLYFDVPILASADVLITSGQIPVNPIRRLNCKCSSPTR